MFCGVCAMALKASAAPDLKEILSAGSSAIGGLVEGVFTTSDLKVSDIAGQWTSEGSAVSFKSENFLKKAGALRRQVLWNRNLIHIIRNSVSPVPC